MIISSVTSPDVTQKYPLAQKCFPQYLFLNSGKISNSFLELLPFTLRIISLAAIFGGADTNICIWSGLTEPFFISISCISHVCLIRSLTLYPTSPTSTYIYILLRIRNDNLFYILYGFHIYIPFYLLSLSCYYISI